MFKLSDSLTFPWPVKVIEPHPTDAGKHAEHVFTVLFRMPPPEEAEQSVKARRAIVEQLVEGLSDKEVAAIGEALTAHDEAQLRALIVGWRDDVVGEDDQPLPFTAENVARVLAYPRVQRALIRAYNEAIVEDQARVKN